MNVKNRKTLQAVFRQPVSASIAWRDIENLFRSVGAESVEGRGSRVSFIKDGVIASFHRPHPEKEAKRYQVRDARAFLERVGIEP